MVKAMLTRDISKLQFSYHQFISLIMMSLVVVNMMYCLLFSLEQIAPTNNLKRYPKESLKKIVQETP